MQQAIRLSLPYGNRLPYMYSSVKKVGKTVQTKVGTIKTVGNTVQTKV
jgi:hypothetical protein